MSFEQTPDERMPDKQSSSKSASSDADFSKKGFDVELQQQLHLFHNRILGEIHHEGQIIQGELRRNRLLMIDELETTGDHIQRVVSGAISRLVRRLNLVLIASIVIILILAAKGGGL